MNKTRLWNEELCSAKKPSLSARFSSLVKLIFSSSARLSVECRRDVYINFILEKLDQTPHPPKVFQRNMFSQNTSSEAFRRRSWPIKLSIKLQLSAATELPFSAKHLNIASTYQKSSSPSTAPMNQEPKTKNQKNVLSSHPLRRRPHNRRRPSRPNNRLPTRQIRRPLHRHNRATSQIRPR